MRRPAGARGPRPRRLPGGCPARPAAAGSGRRAGRASARNRPRSTTVARDSWPASSTNRTSTASAMSSRAHNQLVPPTTSNSPLARPAATFSFDEIRSTSSWGDASSASPASWTIRTESAASCGGVRHGIEEVGDHAMRLGGDADSLAAARRASSDHPGCRCRSCRCRAAPGSASTLSSSATTSRRPASSGVSPGRTSGAALGLERRTRRAAQDQIAGGTDTARIRSSPRSMTESAMRPSAPRIGSGPYGFDGIRRTRVRGDLDFASGRSCPATGRTATISPAALAGSPGRSDSCPRGASSPATDRTGSGIRVTSSIGPRSSTNSQPAERRPIGDQVVDRGAPSAGSGPTTAASPRADASRGAPARSQRPCCSSSRSARSAGTPSRSASSRARVSACDAARSRRRFAVARLRSWHDAVRVERGGLDPALLEPVAETAGPRRSRRGCRPRSRRGWPGRPSPSSARTRRPRSPRR